MKKSPVIITVFLLVILGMGITSVGASSNTSLTTVKPSDFGGETITIVDDFGQYITIPYPVKNVAFLVENAMNSMYAVGGADRISGIGSIWMADKKEPFYLAIDPSFAEKPKLSDANGAIDYDALAEADPDLVVMWSEDWDDEVASDIKSKLNVPVYGVYYTKLSDVSRANSLYAKIIGNEERDAEVSRIMGEYTRKITDITTELQDEERPSVYWMWSDIYGTAGLNSATNDLIRLAGGKNVLEDTDVTGKMLEHPVISFDILQKLNPDVIYLWYTESVDPEDIINGEGEFASWRNLKAVKNGRVFEVADPFIYDSFSPQQPLALMAIAKNIHPDRFQDLNLDAELDSFFASMYGVHYPGYALA